MNTQLLCLFTTKQDLEKSLDFILDNYDIVNPNIFVLENRNRAEELFVTFNIEKGSAAVDSEWKTILVHRKKESNTIYTINALNEVVKSKTGGTVDKSYAIEWAEFKNSILTTASGGYKKISTKIHKTINLSEEEQ
jgi:hypothetical protein